MLSDRNDKMDALSSAIQINIFSSLNSDSASIKFTVTF